MPHLDLTTAQASGCSQLVPGTQGLLVVAPPEQWSYAAIFDLPDLTIQPGSQAELRARIEVTEGAIGVLALANPTTVLGEVFASAASGGIVTLALESPEQVRQIVLRNVAEGGLPSACVVHDIAIMVEAPRFRPRPELIGPYGATPRGFQGKNIFRDAGRLAGHNARIVVDVGANTGDSTDLFLDLFLHCSVHLFEPTPDLLTGLRARFGAQPRVRVHGQAVAASCGTTTLQLSTANPANSLLPFDRAAPTWLGDAVTMHDRCDVESVTLDRFCQDHDIAQIDLLKIDVQGYESRVLAGAAALLAAGRIKVVLIEIMFVPIYEGQGSWFELGAQLAGHGYRLFDFYNFTYANDGQVLWGDALFVRSDPDSSAHP